MLPPIGLKHRQTITVTPDLTVPALPPAMGDFSDFPAILATPYMISFIESVCIAAIKPYLTEEQMTVGTRVDLQHLAATPVGMTITAEAELIAVSEHTLNFRVDCHDEKEKVGTGTHERTLVDKPKFFARLKTKTGTVTHPA